MTELATEEKDKYERAWKAKWYRAKCNSLNLWERRPQFFPEKMVRVLDIGCGTGRLFWKLNEAGIETWGVDIATNCLDPEIKEKYGERFVLQELWNLSLPGTFDFGYCADVMEHIPPSKTGEVFERIAEHCDQVLFQIAHMPATFGELTLHLSLKEGWEWVKEMEGIAGKAEILAQTQSWSTIKWQIKEPKMTEQEQILVVLQMLSGSNDLTKDGKPEAPALAEKLGMKISAKERDELYAKAMAHLEQDGDGAEEKPVEGDYGDLTLHQQENLVQISAHMIHCENGIGKQSGKPITSVLGSKCNIPGLTTAQRDAAFKEVYGRDEDGDCAAVSAKARWKGY